MFEMAAILWRNRHEIAASFHGRFGIATKIAAKIAA